MRYITTLIKVLAAVSFLFPSTVHGQSRIDWQAHDACGAGPASSASQILYTSAGQPIGGFSGGSATLLSGYLSVLMVPSGAPTIVAQSSLDFGTVIVGQDATRQMTVSNSGSLPLDITGTSISPSVFTLVSGGGRTENQPWRIHRDDPALRPCSCRVNLRGSRHHE
ncbi:MAG: hypothetical protein QHI48_00465 [Bacteroidota bacterium]|nr:hypothetical protein [Bacteroidota bacterium]